ncbi:MAG: CHAT domain-containing protein [Crinalium sp.]
MQKFLSYLSLRPRLQFYSCLSVTLFLSLIYPVLPIAFSWDSVSAQTQVSQDQKAQADRLEKIALEHLKQDQYQKALEGFQQVLKIRQALGDEAGIGKTLRRIAGAYSGLGQSQTALEYFRRALDIATKINDRTEQASILWAIGFLDVVEGKQEQGLESLKQALSIFQDTQNMPDVVKVSLSMSIAYGLRDQTQQALEVLSQALEITRKFNLTDLEAKVLINIGEIYSRQNQYEKAISFLQLALPKVDNLLKKADILATLGLAYNKTGKYIEAENTLRQGLSLIRENLSCSSSKNRDLDLEECQSVEVRILQNLTFLYIDLNQIDKARYYLSEARRISSTDGEVKPPASDNSNQFAEKLEAARQRLIESQKIGMPQMEALGYQDIAGVYKEFGYYNEALSNYQEALKIANQFGYLELQAVNLMQMGILYNKIGKDEQALKYFQQSVNAFKKFNNNNGTLTNLYFIALLQRKNNQLVSATETLQNAADLLDTLRVGLPDNYKISVLDGVIKKGIYQNLQQILVAQNQFESALEVAERGRARAFVELLNAKLSSTASQLSQLPPLKLQQIKQIAKTQNATIVEYSIIKFREPGYREEQEEFYIWVVKPTGEVRFKKIDLKAFLQEQNTTLANLVTNSRVSVSIGIGERGIFEATSDIDPSQSLKQLHQLLIEPIANLLPKDPNARVIFVPQQELFLVPFPALLNADGKYLIEKHTILTAPAIAVLDLTHKKRPQVSGKGALVVGNPTMPKIGNSTQPLPALPGAEKEAIAIAQLLKTKPLTGNSATKAATVKAMSNARIIHLATHGLLDEFEAKEVPGAIALAPEGKDNGLLTSAEIFDMKLNAELVVLSACNTGVGKITGDGVIGVSRSLITAGVPSVIVSLWSVPDAPTKDLMTQFYQNWQKNFRGRQAPQKPDLQRFWRFSALTKIVSLLTTDSQ